MRTGTLGLLAGLLLSGIATAQAADLDYGVLRGPDYEPVDPLIDWSGGYIGGHGGYSSAALGHNNVFQPILADHFRARNIEAEFAVSTLINGPSVRVDGTSFGVFAGYNVQFDNTVLGVEVDYTRFGRIGTSENTIARSYTTSAGLYESVYLQGVSSTKIEDYGTVRARAGYAIGNFLPFVTGGIAIGRASVTDQVTVQNYSYDKATYDANQRLTNGTPSYVQNHGYASFNQSFPGNRSTPSGAGVQTVPNSPIVLPTRSKIKTVGGVTLGAGLEFAVTQNIVLRGEYQYVLFNDFDSHKANINTVRAGAALKF